jgi:hypothetical protein
VNRPGRTSSMGDGATVGSSGPSGSGNGGSALLLALGRCRCAPAWLPFIDSAWDDRQRVAAIASYAVTARLVHVVGMLVVWPPASQQGIAASQAGDMMAASSRRGWVWRPRPGRPVTNTLQG